MVKTPNKPKPSQRTQIQLLEQGDLFRQNKRPVRVFRKSTKRFLLGCKNTNLFLKRLEKDKDKNVDADRDRTGRPVVSGQPTGSSTPFDEVNIDFRVSGLLHAVVKQAENSRVRELVKKIEKHPHRQALQADLQQNNAYNPFSQKSKKMIRTWAM